MYIWNSCNFYYLILGWATLVLGPPTETYYLESMRTTPKPNPNPNPSDSISKMPTCVYTNPALFGRSLLIPLLWKKPSNSQKKPNLWHSCATKNIPDIGIIFFKHTITSFQLLPSDQPKIAFYRPALSVFCNLFPWSPSPGYDPGNL